MNAVRRAIWTAGALFRVLLVGSIKFYRVTLSSILGGQCRFYPTCSNYGEEAVRVHGAIKGSTMAIWRILRCHPFSKGGVEHVPERRARSVVYDSVVHRSRV